MSGGRRTSRKEWSRIGEGGDLSKRAGFFSTRRSSSALIDLEFKIEHILDQIRYAVNSESTLKDQEIERMSTEAIPLLDRLDKALARHVHDIAYGDGKTEEEDSPIGLKGITWKDIIRKKEKR